MFWIVPRLNQRADDEIRGEANRGPAASPCSPCAGRGFHRPSRPRARVFAVSADNEAGLALANRRRPGSGLVRVEKSHGRSRLQSCCSLLLQAHVDKKQRGSRQLGSSDEVSRGGQQTPFLPPCPATPIISIGNKQISKRGEGRGEVRRWSVRSARDVVCLPVRPKCILQTDYEAELRAALPLYQSLTTRTPTLWGFDTSREPTWRAPSPPTRVSPARGVACLSETSVPPKRRRCVRRAASAAAQTSCIDPLRRRLPAASPGP